MIFRSLSTRRQGTGARALVATVLTALVSGTLSLTAAPVAGAQEATDGCSPYSTLSCDQLALDPPVGIDWAQPQGGLGSGESGNGAGTGFTLLQPSTFGTWKPERTAVDAAAGTLSITSTAGIAYKVPDASPGENALDNALGVGLPSATGRTAIETTLVAPPTGTGKAEQAGLWFGPSEDDYVKLVVASASTSAVKVQLVRERGGAATSTDEKNSATFPVNGQDVRLTLEMDAAAGSATATYSVGSAAPVVLGTLADLPARFFDGSSLDPAAAAAAGMTALAGIHASHRNNTTTPGLVYTFRGFSVTQPDSTPPAAPTALTSSATTDEVSLSWDAPADTDVAGYQVFRGTTSPVPTTGTPLSGETPISATTLTDDGVLAETAYTYAVRAVDEAGNAGPTVETTATPPAPEGEVVAKVNFQPAGAPVPDGYTADTGAAFTEAAGRGWVAADGAGAGSPLDFTANTRDRERAGIDQRLDTIVHTQFRDVAPTSTTGQLDDGAWELVVPDGTYSVLATVGDQKGSTGYDSQHTVQAEGAAVITAFQATAAREYEQAGAQVEVTDGRLTISPGDGFNTKFAFLEVRAVDVADTTPPAAPTGLAAEAVDGGVELTWTPGGDADLAGYRVYRSAGTSPVDPTGTPVSGEQLLTAATFTDSSVEPGTAYSYVVTAVDGDGNASGPSTAADVTTPPPADTTAPAAPTGLEAVVADDAVELTWTANDEADLAGYRVHRSDGATVDTTAAPLSGTELLTSASFTDTTAAPGATYSYAVIAVDDAGNASPASAAETVTLPAAPPPPVVCADTEYRAEYFAGTDLAGDPVAVRCEAAIDNDWGLGTPAGVEGLDVDAFSVRWTQSRELVAGTYDFTVEADDGIRTLVDGANVLDDWSRHGPRVKTAQQTLAAGRHQVVVEYFEAGGGALARAGYAVAPVVDPVPTCTASQWQAQYFDGRALAGEPAAVRCEDAVDIDFGAGGPEGVDSVGVDDFSVRWSTARTLSAGTYALTATADDGIRVLVDGAVVLDGFVDQGPTTYDAEIVLAEGQHTVVVEYYENGGGALARFGMSRQPDEVVCPDGEFRAEYFNGTALDGAPVAVRCEPAVDYDFGLGAPQGVPVGTDGFSVRWTREADLPAGTYAYTATADDGVRVLVDDSAVIDAWKDQGATTYTGERTLDAGRHTLVVEYYEAGGGALVQAVERPVPGGVVCADGEYRAEYYDSRTLEGTPVAVRCEADIDNDWGAGAPEGVSGLGSDDFSVRWTATPTLEAGSYAFSATADDGIRVRVDGEPVLDEWRDQGPTDFTAERALGAGPHQVVVEYYERGGGSLARFGYSRTTTPPAPPAAPTGLTASGGDGVVELSWQPVEGDDVAGYRVYRGTALPVATTGEPLSGAALLSTPAFTDSAVENGTTYSYVVVAVSGAGAASEASAPASATPVAPVPFSLALNFQTDAAPVPAGFTKETGQAYTAERGYGWVRQDSLSGPRVPLDLTLNVRDRNRTGIAQELDTLVHAQYGDITPTPSSTNGNLTPGAFEAAVPDGTYTVSVSVGDQPGAAKTATQYPPDGCPAPCYDSKHTVRAEGITLLDRFVSTAAQEYRTATGQITVTDGLLTLDAIGGENTKLNWVRVERSAPDTVAPGAPSALTAAAGDAQVALTWTASVSIDAVGYRVHRSTSSPVDLSSPAVSGPSLVTGTSFTDTTAVNGTAYHYAVVAVDGADNVSAPSNEAAATPEELQALALKVNFSDAATAPPVGHVRDVGEPYGARTGEFQGTGLSYGWVTPGTSTPVSLVGNGRLRAGDLPLRDRTLMHMQYGDVLNGTQGVDAPGAWELAVPDGLYEVTVSAGDQAGAGGVYDSEHVLNIERGVGIERYVGTSLQERSTATVRVRVEDGRLTIDPVEGENTKINWVEITQLADLPVVTSVLPANRATGADVNGGVSASINAPGDSVGVDPTTLTTDNVKLFDIATGAEVPGTSGSSGGNDVIAFDPNEPLAPETRYRFVVTDGVRSEDGTPFVPFTSVFTTGDGVVTAPEEFTPVTGVSFTKVEQTIGRGKYYASMDFGPDGKLYATTIGQGIFRYDVDADGDLSNEQSLGFEGRAVIGLVFDPASTPTDPILWITHSTANIDSEQDQWASKVSRLSGPDLATVRDVFVKLPRSLKDHLTNSIAFGPDGDLYFLQGSNQAAGDLDGSWGTRGEKLLTAAVLHFDPDHPAVRAALDGGAPIDVQTSDGGTYDPYAAGAPLKLYATGVRNAYDLVWHSNGHLYVPTNGTAGGGNSPGVTKNADGTYTRTGQVPGVDVTGSCARRIDGKPYTGPSVPAITNHPTQRDSLYDVQRGGYYGHPNPERCEFVLHNGGSPDGAGQGGSKYAPGVAPDPNYKGVAFDFEFNKSPNGAIEYQSATFGGQLKNRLMVVRFSNNNDLIVMQPDQASGKILGAQLETGITGVPDTTIGGIGGFKDPLEVTEDPRTGNLYVNQYDRGGSEQTMWLLRVPADQQAASVTADDDELVFSAANRDGSGNTYVDPVNVPQEVTVTNNGTQPVTLTSALSGTHAAKFTVTNGSGELAPGASRTLSVAFVPAGTDGPLSATLTVSGGEGAPVTVGLHGLAANGLFGGREPTLAQAYQTLGFSVDNGWSGLAGGIEPTAKGDEVLEPLFEKAGTGPVTMTPVAAYAPQESLPFGWYTADGTRNEVGALANGQLQRLNPQQSRGTQSFDPGTQVFGFWYFSNTFARIGWTEDGRNDGSTHRARIYPMKDRAGRAVANTYVVAFEDASNGDYQDYVFVVRNVKPQGSTGPVEPPPPAGDAVRVNFSNAAAPVPSGYVRDHGQGYGARTGTGQGSGLSYGWLDQATENPIDLSVGGTTPGNGRTRGLNPDARLDTLMHMQSADLVDPQKPGGTFNGTAAYAFWEMALPAGTYEVTVAAGDASVNNDPEAHTINVENTPLINAFVPTGTAGSATRHTTVTKVVEVTDGRLSLDANGGENTKINYVDVVPVAPAAADVQVSFRPATAPVPAGWTADTGLGFDAARGFGWVAPGTSTPIDRSNAARLRTAPADPLLQGLSIMQNDEVTTLSNGAWEHALPNGTYTVEVSVGDGAYFDSTHSVEAEGVDLVAKFVPAGAGDFETGVADVTVSDGRLTVQPGDFGANTKINWIKISGVGDGDTTAPSVDVAVSGSQDPAGAYLNTAQVAVDATDVGGSGLATVTLAVDGGAPAPYTEPVTVSGPGSHTVVATATDGDGNTTTESTTFSIVAFEQTDGVLALSNPEEAPFPDRLVMSRIESTVSSPQTKSTAQLVLRNTGTEPYVLSSLSASGTAFQVTAPTALPVTVPAGGQATVDVAFTASITTSQPRNRLFEETLTLFTDASNGGSTEVELAGMWQRQSENGDEPDVAQISRTFGYGTTILDAGQQLNNKGVVTTVGDEILSPYWGRADKTKPVTVRQLAAYHSCCTSTATFNWHAKGSNTTSSVLTHNGAWAQTLLPRKSGTTTGAAVSTFTPSSAVFGFKIDPEWSDPTKNNKTADVCPGQPAGVETETCKLGHHVRVWPAEDRAGVAIPGTYLVTMDYSGINYDFNDNVYLVSNVVPEAQIDSTAPAAPTGLTAVRGSGGVTLDWADSPETDLAGYDVERAATSAGPWTKVNASRLTASTHVDGSAPTTALVYRVVASDSSGNTSPASATASVAEVPGAIRINAGGAAQTVSGTTWSACSSTTACSGRVSGGFAYSETGTTSGVPAGMNNAIFQTEWTGGASGPAGTVVPVGQRAFGFDVPVAAGTYTVRLHFAELNKNAAGLRTFDVVLEGSTVLSNFDVWSQAGGMDKAIVREFPVEVTDGKVTIDFLRRVENAKISAIEIVPGGSTSQPAAPTATWSTVSAAAAPHGSSESQSVVVDGKYYYFGGFAPCCTPTRRAYAFDPATSTWTALAPLPRGLTHAGIAAVGRKVYLAGGYIENAAGTGQVFGSNLGWVYDIDANTYTALPNLPVHVSGGSMAVLPAAGGGHTLHHVATATRVAGDRGTDYGDHYVLPLGSAGAPTATAWSTRAALPVPRQHAGMVALGGQLWFVGGQTGHDGSLTTKADVHAYDPGTDTWTARAALPSPRGHISNSTFVHSGRIVVSGGESAHGSALSGVLTYTPATNSWTPSASLPAARVSGVAGSTGSQWWFLTGSGTTTAFKATLS